MDDFNNSACPLGLTLDEFADALSWPELPELYAAGKTVTLLRFDGLLLEKPEEVFLLKFIPIVGDPLTGSHSFGDYQNEEGYAVSPDQQISGFAIRAVRESDGKSLAEAKYMKFRNRFDKKLSPEGGRTIAINDVPVSFNEPYESYYGQALTNLAASASQMIHHPLRDEILKNTAHPRFQL